VADVLERLKAALSDRYTIERELGSGGMATVYLADDLKLHRKVAVKVLRPELAAALGPDRFVQEIDIAAKVSRCGTSWQRKVNCPLPRLSAS
jgi:serine/threonine-protein kinase